jgi:superfamily II DNA or RNA helicase
MLNEYLPLDELHQSLIEYTESWNWILGQIYPQRNLNLFEDRPLLAKLHHSLNVGRYSQQKFRFELMQYAPQEKLREFVEKTENKQPSHTDLKSSEYLQTLASFQWGTNAKTRTFIDVFGYPDYLMPSEQESVVGSQFFEKPQNPFKPLKDYQSQIFFDALKIIEFPNKKFLIQMPTGSGKTRVAMEIVSHFLNKKEGRQVVWLADRKELCEQADDTFRSIWSHEGKFDLTLYKLWGDIKVPKKINGTAFIITMYQKIRNILKERSLLKADLIVADEAHNVLAPTYEEVIDKLKDRRNKQTRIVGLTATPGRKYGESEQNERLAAFFANRILKIDSGNDGVISYLQRKRILAHAIRKPLETKIQYNLTQEEWKALSKSYSADYPDELVERIANDQKRNLIITLRLRELAKECKRILVFAGSKKQSKLLCGLFIALGFSAAHVDGETPSNYRGDVVEKFKKGEIQFVFNYGVFTTGFDVPKIDAVVIARPTTSIVLYGQMIGRGMRGLEIDGTEEFQLIDVVDNIITEYSGLDNVYDYFSDYWGET